LVGGEGVGCAAATVERHHQLSEWALTQGRSVHESRQLWNESGMLASRQPRLNVFLYCRRVELFQPGGLRSRPVLALELPERWPTPERERFLEPPLCDESSEATCVDLLAVELEAIAGWLRNQCAPHDLPQLRNSQLQRVHRVDR
jgi:hypothetical protein